MRKAILFFLVACATGTVCRAQFDDDSVETATASSSSGAAAPARKRPSFWRRPKRATPERQLAYAKELEERGARGKSAGQYRALVRQWHETPEAVAAQWAYSRLLEERGKYERAFDEYQYLIHFYPLRIDYNAALDRQLAVANQVLAERRLAVFGFAGFEAPERALRMFERIVENAPGWTRAAEAQYRVGWICEQLGEFEDAVDAYTRALDRYPGSEFEDAAAFGRAYCLYRVARRSPRNEAACRDALSALATYVNKYAGSAEHRAAAEEYIRESNGKLAAMYYDRARFYDRTRRYKAAVLAYGDFVRMFPGDAAAGEARRRVADLQSRTEQ